MVKNLFGRNEEDLKGEIAVIKNSVVALDNKVIEENKLLKTKYSEVKTELTHERKLRSDLEITVKESASQIDFLTKQYEQIVSILAKEKQEQEQENNIKSEIDKMVKDGWHSYDDACKLSGAGITQTELKYYLFENGILSKNINKLKNTFSLKSNDITSYPQYIQDHCKIYKTNLLFDEWMIQFIIKNKKEIKKASSNMVRKKEEYETTREKLEKINFKNYRDEIKRILNGDSLKYKVAYDKFAEKFTSFYEDWEVVARNNSDNPKYKMYGLRKLEYICTFMGEGTYFLKVVCELFA